MSDFTTNDFTSDRAVPSIEKNTTASTTNGASFVETAQAKAAAAANAVANHPYTENVINHPTTQSVINGPVAQNVKNESAKTQAEFSNLAASRQTPSTPAATGQQLTHYHSFFSSLLSWNNPRASGIAYASIVSFIFAARYLDILRYAFKATWVTLGITVLAEVAGKAVLSHGLASQFRPRKYYTVSKSTLDSLTGDFSEFVNFFVIESQRIVFAENLLASITAFLGAFISYYLIKVVPFWGLTLISATVLFITPLVYKTNKETIDHYIAEATDIVNQQSKQVREMAAQQASRASETTKQYVGDYSSKAQELIGNARGRSSSPTTVKSEPVLKQETSSGLNHSGLNSSGLNHSGLNNSGLNNSGLSNSGLNSSAFKSDDFPAAPREDFRQQAPSVEETINSLKHDDPLISA